MQFFDVVGITFGNCHGLHLDSCFSTSGCHPTRKEERSEGLYLKPRGVDDSRPLRSGDTAAERLGYYYLIVCT